MADQRAIGMMDSGFGGVAVLKRAMEMLPNESFVFYGDNANAPYGEKDRQTIQALSIHVAEELIRADVKCIVIACNTATSAAIDKIRAHFALPVVSMEPAIKPAIEYSRGKGKILMMATAATCRLERYQERKQQVDVHHQVIDLPCHDLVEMIESYMIGGKVDFKALVEELLDPYRNEEVMGIVMGCTHFTFAEKEIENYAKEHFGPECKLFDGREGTVRQLIKVLKHEKLEASPGATQEIKLMSSGDTSVIIPSMKAFLQR